MLLTWSPTPRTSETTFGVSSRPSAAEAYVPSGFGCRDLLSVPPDIRPLTPDLLLMHVSELLDLAALLALSGRRLVHDNPRLVDDALHTYWSASRCRLDRWGRGMRGMPTTSNLPDSESSKSTAVVPWVLAEEVLVSEVVSRTVAALFVAHDKNHLREEAGPIARNVLYGHIDARRRLLRLSPTATDAPTSPPADIQKLFARCARWNDLLLGHLLQHAAVEEFAFDTERAREFSIDADQFAVDPATEEMASTLLRSSLRISLAGHGETPEGYSSQLNAQIGAAVMSCFGPELFDSFGLLKSTWQQRIESAADDTLCMVDRLIEDDQPPGDRWQT